MTVNISKGPLKKKQVFPTTFQGARSVSPRPPSLPRCGLPPHPGAALRCPWRAGTGRRRPNAEAQPVTGISHHFSGMIYKM